jgi:hypothetical protein
MDAEVSIRVVELEVDVRLFEVLRRGRDSQSREQHGGRRDRESLPMNR